MRRLVLLFIAVLVFAATSESAFGQDVAVAPVERLWRSTAIGDQPLRILSSPSIAPDGSIWVANGAESRFLIFAPDGTFVEAWGTEGAGEGEFDFSRDPTDGLADIAFAPDGSFYVADSQNKRIQRFDQDRRFVSAWGGFGTGDGQFAEPVGVALDESGNVYVADDVRSDVQKFDPDGRFLLAFGGAASNEGRLGEAGWLSIDSEGVVWVADTGRSHVVAFDSDGAFLRVIGEGELNQPQNVAVDSTGRVFVADTGSGRVVVFDRDGQVLTSWTGGEDGGTPFGDVVGIALDGAGHVYVTDFTNTYEAIQKFRLLPPLTTVATPVA
jgi:DNA-binding beta-propeller fold protein YncE